MMVETLTGQKKGGLVFFLVFCCFLFSFFGDIW